MARRVHFAAMPAVPETLIARLEADCTAAEQAERSVRSEIEARLREVERARAFAWRRLNVLKDMMRTAANEADRAVSVERQLIALFRDIGWIEGGLDELGPGALPLLDRLRPIAEALHGACHPDETDDPTTNGAGTDILAAFLAFEEWFEADRGQPFLQVFERYMPPTPAVEF
jgi:hypothetical protein